MGEGASQPGADRGRALRRGEIRAHSCALMLPTNRLAASLVLVLLLLVGTEVRGAKAPAPSSTPLKKEPQAPVKVLHNAWTLKNFRQFIDARYGRGENKVVWWSLEGQLTSPLTGDVIADLRGVEVSKCIGRGNGHVTHPNPRQKRLLGRGGARLAYEGLATADLLHGVDVLSYATVLTRKTFVYLDCRTGEVMRSFRMSTRSRPKDVPPPPAMMQVLTYALIRDKSGATKLRLIAERPDGSTVQVDSQGGPSVHRSPFSLSARWDLSLLMWPGSRRLAILQRRRSKAIKEGRSGGGDGEEKRWMDTLGSLIQLGPIKASPAVREVYSLTVTPLRRPFLRYVRYGEGPYWFGGGRSCNLALQSTRYGRFSELPSETRRAVLGQFEGEGDEARRSSVGREVASLEDVKAEGEEERQRDRKRYIFF